MKGFRRIALPFMAIAALAMPTEAVRTYDEPRAKGAVYDISQKAEHNYLNGTRDANNPFSGLAAFAPKNSPEEYWGDVCRIHKALGFEKSTIAALVETESGWDKDAVSITGAKNLGQLTWPAFNENYRLVHSNDPYYEQLREKYPNITNFVMPRLNNGIAKDWHAAKTDPSANLDICFAYLKLRLMERRGDLGEALGDYKAGQEGKKTETDFVYAQLKRFESAKMKYSYLDSPVFLEPPAPHNTPQGTFGDHAFLSKQLIRPS